MQGFPAVARALLTRYDSWPGSGLAPMPVSKKHIHSALVYLVGEVIRHRGPFSESAKIDNLGNLVATAVDLFPWGIPVRPSGWRRFPYLVENAEYEEWRNDVPNRAATTPISDKTGSCVILSVLLLGS